MNNPFARIIFAVILFLIICGGYYLSEGTPLVTLFYIVNGAVVGVPRGLALPFGFLFKLGYIITLAVSITAITIGIRTKKFIFGQILVFLGVAIWFACGFVGVIVITVE